MKDGGPAFPSNHERMTGTSLDFRGCLGMSLRQWYAGMAMQGIIVKYGASNGPVVSKEAFEIADDMLEQEHEYD